jgi:hypothetical protein
MQLGEHAVMDLRADSLAGRSPTPNLVYFSNDEDLEWRGSRTRTQANSGAIFSHAEGLIAN